MQQQQAASPFGIIVPGQIVQTQFEQFGDKGILTIQNPATINVIGFYMTQPLGDDQMGASLYYSTPPDYSGMTFVGAIANSRPSDIFHTGFSLNPSINTQTEIKLVVQLEPLQNIETQIKIAQETDFNQVYAKKVAENLFTYLRSFSQDQNLESQGLMVVPHNSLDKWLDKFMQKYQRDPNFIFKTNP